jgi:hypothetical protein
MTTPNETPITDAPTEAEQALIAKVSHLRPQLVSIEADGNTRRDVKFFRNGDTDAAYFYVD